MVASIDFIERVISNYERATEANWRTPTRQGNVVELTTDDADELLISADLHGHRRNFNAIRKLADLEQHARRHLVLQEVCHGGPVYPANGGCMSHAMLEDVAQLKANFPDRVHFLFSNHELAELTDYPILKSKKMLNLMFRLGMQQMYGAATERVRAAYQAFIRSCPLALRLPGGIFICHSLPERADVVKFDRTIFDRELDIEDLREHGEVFRLVWGRDYRPENASAFARMVGARILIHGHEPCPSGFSVPNETQIILDCCGDNACCLLLPVREQEFSQSELVAMIRKLA